MKQELKDILAKIPSSWKEVKIKDYIELGKIELDLSKEFNDVVTDTDNNLKVISIFTGVPVSELENFSMLEIGKMSEKLSFMESLPVVNKSSKINWKSVEEITYNDYVVFQQFGLDPYNNLHLIIPSFSKYKVSPDVVLEMNVEDVHTAFFLLRKTVKKSTNNMKRYLRIQLLKAKLKERMKKTLSLVK